MSHVDLCSGIGGFALGFEWAGLSKPVLFCDIEPWSRKVLSKHWPDVPIAHDVKELANDPDRFIPRTDPRNTILTSGYPCQPFSVAGKQRGTEDDRHIWPFISQIIAHKRPAFCVLENVYGHVALGLDEVLADLEAQDYATRAFIVPACGVNAPHRRDRIWIIAHTNSHGEPDGTINEKQGCGKLVGNSEHDGSFAATVSGKHGQDEARCAEGQSASEQSEGASEPGHDANVGNAAHNGCSGWGEANGREGKTHQLQQQSGIRGKSIGSGENVADTDSKPSKVRGQYQTDATESLCGGSDARGSRGNDWREFGTSALVGNVADTNGEGLQGHTNANRQRLGQSRRQQITDQSFSRRRENVADTDSQRGSRWASWNENAEDAGQSPRGQEHRGWNTEPSMGRVADGLPKGLDRFDGWEREPADISRVATGVKDRVSRLKGLGNAIVPSIAMQIGLTIKAVRDA
jgi:DNA (cytosine-5)-methyltransferase 1